MRLSRRTSILAGGHSDHGWCGGSGWCVGVHCVFLKSCEEYNVELVEAFAINSRVAEVLTELSPDLHLPRDD